MQLSLGLNKIKDLVIVGLGAIVIWQGLAPKELEEIRLRSANGNSIVLSAKGKNPEITMSSSGVKILSAGIYTDGSPYLMVSSNQNRSSLLMDAGKNGSALIITDPKTGRKRIILASIYDWPGLVILDNKGVATATLPNAKKK